MAGFNPSDNTYAIVAETTPGTIPATPAWIQFGHVPGTMPELDADNIDSPTLNAGRGASGTRKVNYRVTGGLAVHFRRHTAIELLLTSAFSGTWSTNVLKASNIDQSFTIQKSMKNAAGGTDYQRFVGCQVAKFNLKCDSAGIASAQFDVLGMGRDASNAAVTGATQATVTNGTPLAGLDVSAVSIAGVTGTFDTLDFTVEHSREAQSQFGQNSARGIGTSGFRKATLVLTMYRDSIAQEAALLGDTGVAVSFTIGSATNGYTVTLTNATCDVPKDVENNSRGLIQMTFTAGVDGTNNDVQITRLT